MSTTGEHLPTAFPGVARILGRLSGSDPGPTLVCVGGLHGNEIAGVLAIHRVLERIRSAGNLPRGELLAISGNRGALAEGRRFLARDLNRSWTAERMKSLPHPETSGAGLQEEDREQQEIRAVLDEVEAGARGPVFLLDLHTTSSASAPFTATMNQPRNLEFALGFPVPLILGFGEMVDGTFFGYLSGRGITSMVFEGGQHRDSASVERSEAAIWLAMAGADILSGDESPEISRAYQALRGPAGDLPRVLEIRHRHPVAEGDGFRMRPGFENLQRVAAGETLARDHHGAVKASESGRLLLPLYQAQGDDGFFLVREPDQARRSGAA